MEEKDEEQISNIVKAIKYSPSQSKLYHYLKLLRSKVDDKSQFTNVLNNGGLRLILTLLPTSNLQIVDIILSIVGNCCMDRNCAKEVVKYHGLRLMCDLLQKYEEDSVVCRVFRIYGNIAQFENYASEIIKYNIVSFIVKLLRKAAGTVDNNEEITNKEKSLPPSPKISLDSVGMAVRTLRLLWQSYSNRQKMTEEGVVKAVFNILIVNTQIWQAKTDSESQRKRREKLLENILKCLLLYTKWGSQQCTQQMLELGPGFKSLVALIDLYPYNAIKCITNLSHFAKSRSDIDISAAVEKITEKIKYYMCKKPNRGCPTEIVNAYCLFSRHPMNCIEVRKAGGLPLILDVLKYCRSRRQEFQILQAIPGFLNDEASQEILVSCGVVKIVISCIERNLKSKSALNESHTYVKSKRAKSEISLNLLGSAKKKIKIDNTIQDEKKTYTEKSPILSELYNKMHMLTGQDILSACMSPSDSESVSPISSPSCTPPRKFGDDDDDDDSLNYSPVCSDTEELNTNDNSTSNVPASLLSPDFCDKSDEECESERMHFESSDSQEKAVIVMLIILSRILHIKPYPADLRSAKTIETLLKYFRETRNPKGRILKVLEQIVSNPDNLITLISSNTMYTIHSLMDLEHDGSCARCKRMAGVGEYLLDNMAQVATSDKGKSIIHEQMTSDNPDVKRKWAVCVPYVVKIKSFLHNLMNSCGGLQILLTQFLNDNDNRFHIIGALNKLACSVNINNPCSQIFPPRTLKISDYKFDQTGKNIVIIKLDDGQKVTADRDFLIDNVEYFKAMLCGSFKEAEQDSIRLQNVSYEALNFLLFLLGKDVKKIEPCPLKLDLTVVLEVIVLTDSYLLESLTEWLTSCVEGYMINAKSASLIYKWSIESGTNFLRVETVAFLLTGKMSENERFKLCENIFENELMHQLHDDFHELIFRYLKIK